METIPSDITSQEWDSIVHEDIYGRNIMIGDRYHFHHSLVPELTMIDFGSATVAKNPLNPSILNLWMCARVSTTRPSSPLYTILDMGLTRPVSRKWYASSRDKSFLAVKRTYGKGTGREQQTYAMMTKGNHCFQILIQNYEIF
ncbi:hypothetical protein F5Y18DRAFT_408544 [Xylariaceae sp. FL1019]|nr:hypothetical protein F5Y18DRAFT_408544 [Xylariaceae sp. FL1019]